MTQQWPARVVPRYGQARMDASDAVATLEGWRGEITVEQLCDELAPFFDAEWCVEAILHGLRSRPDGTVHPHVRTSRRLDWVRYRLNQWRTQDGPLRPPVAADSGTSSDRPAETNEGASPASRNRQWPRSVVPESGDQYHAATRSLRQLMRWEDVTDNELGELIGPFFGAGWSVDCVTHAMRTDPLTGKAVTPDEQAGRKPSDRVRSQLGRWMSRSGVPKSPPKPTLSYSQWYDRQLAAGEFDVRERRQGRSQAQVESVRQLREVAARRRWERAQDRIADSRDRDRRMQDSLDALGATTLLPANGVESGPAAVKSQHERLIEGIFYLEATHLSVVRWLRDLVEMDPGSIGPHTAAVTRARMRDARVQASLASLESIATGTELSSMAGVVSSHVAAGPDLEVGHEVREMWQVLRKAFRDHGSRADDNGQRKRSTRGARSADPPAEPSDGAEQKSAAAQEDPADR